MSRTALIAVVVAAAACGDHPSPVDAALERCADTPCRNQGACTDTSLGVRCTCTDGFAGDHCELATWSLPAPTHGLDLLFVVDNSASMQSEQQRLVAAFGDLVTALTEVGGRRPDLHVGVVSSNVGAAGQSGVPGCPGQGDDGDLQATNVMAAQHCPSLTDAFASDVATASGRDTNYTGSLDDTFACLATRGTSGCGFEMHLESAWRALQPGKNPGFYRDDAHLAVIVLADEDDCSTRDGALFGDPTAGLTSELGPRTSFRCHEFGVVCDDDPAPRAFGEKSGCRPIASPTHEFPVTKYSDFFAALKAHPRRLSMAGIVGAFDGSHLTVMQDPAQGAPVGYAAVKRSCGYDEADPDAGASPPVRIAAVLDALGPRALRASACDTSFADTMRRIGDAVGSAMAGTLCLDTALAGDPATGCSVMLATTPVPACAAGPAPICWSIGTDARACPDGQTALSVTLDATVTLPADAKFDVTCATP